MASVLTSFSTWKEFLSDRVKQAEKAGMDEDKLSKLAFELGEYLTANVDPKNNEQRVLKELWDAGNDQERQTMARLMVRLVEKS